MKKSLLLIFILLTCHLHLHANSETSEFVFFKNEQVKDSIKNNTLKRFVKKIASILEIKRNRYIEKKNDSTDELFRMKQLKKYLPDSLHIEKYWDSIYKIKYHKYQAETSQLRKEVFGFHPYWKGNAYKNYNYRLLSAVSYFSYVVNPETGNYKTIGYWKTTSLIDSAKVNNCDVYLTVTNFSVKNNNVFLKNSIAQENSIHKIIQLLNLRNADGVTIDFEGVTSSTSDLFNSYIKNLSEALEKENKKITLTLPGINYEDAYDVNTLQKYVRRFLVMGYNFSGPWSKKAGAEAPIGSLKKSMNYYLSKGVPKKKLILVLPYYGSQWLIGGKEDAKGDLFKKYITYRDIKLRFKSLPLYDDKDRVAYINTKKGKNNLKTIYDDAKTLGEKYDYVNNQGFAGVGIWALGYDNGYNDLWKVIDKKFGRDAENKKNKPLPKQETWLDILKNKNLLKALIILVFTIFIGGGFLSLRHKEVRAFVYNRKRIRVVVLAFFPSLIILISWNIKKNISMIFLFVGVVLGYIIYYIVNSFSNIEDKKIP